MLDPALSDQSYYGARLEQPEHRGVYHDAEAEKAIFGEEGLSFESLLDAINPLHHIPIVNSIYSGITGDKIAPGPAVIGGFLFGGVVGVVGSIAKAAFEAIAGEDIGSYAVSLFDGESGQEAPDGTVTIGEMQLAGADGAAEAAAAPAPAADAPADAIATPTDAVPELTASAHAALEALARQSAGQPEPAATPAVPGQAAAAAQAAAAQAAMQNPAALGAASRNPGMFTARSAAAAADPARQAAAQQAAAQAGATQPPAGLERLANAQPSDMPQLPPDLDARLSHAQKALAASGLVAVPDAALQQKIGAMLGQPAGAAVPPPPSAQGQSVQGQPMQAQQAQGQQVQGQQVQADPMQIDLAQVAQAQMLQAQAQAHAQVQGQPQAIPTRAAAPAAAVDAGGRRFMPLDNARAGRRWFGLGTADVVPSAVPDSPQMAAQALASQVYRQQAAAMQAASSKVDVSF